MKTYNCLFCGEVCNRGHSKVNKYCSNICQGNYTWEHMTKPAIVAGTLSCHNITAFKKYLIETKGETCALCGIPPTWNGKSLTLQLDHIDGNSDNNFPSNLQLLCPNCHTQTDTFGSKGVGSRYKKTAKRNIYLQQYKN